MGVTAISGPQIIYGFSQTSSGQVTEYNEERGPSLNDLGQGMTDPRPAYCYQPGGAVGQNVRGFWNGYAAVDAIPGTISSNCIAQTQVPTATGSYTVVLTSASSNNTVITAGVSLSPPEGGVTVTGLLGIDMASSTITGGNFVPGVDVVKSSNTGLQTITYGSGNTIHIWDPRAASARTLQWGGSSNSSAEVLSVAGRDLYGFKMTESIASVVGATTNGSTTNFGKKAWKYISTITLNATSGTIGSTNLVVGVNDVYGFPIRVDHAAYATLWWGASSNASLITLSTGNHTFASTLGASQVTSTTPDVRGVWASTTASNSSAAAPQRLVIFVTPSAQNLPQSFSDVSGFFGVAQFSSI